MTTQDSPQFFYFVPNQPHGPGGKRKSFNSKVKSKTGKSSGTKRNGSLTRHPSSQQKVTKNQNVSNNKRLSNNRKKSSVPNKSSSSRSSSSGLWSWLACSCTINARNDIVDSSPTDIPINENNNNISQTSMSIGDDNSTLHPKSSAENMGDDDNSEIFQQLEDAGQVNYDGTAEFGAHGLNSRNTSAYNTFGFLDDATASIPNSRNVSIYRMTSDDSGASQLECSTDTEARPEIITLHPPVVHSHQAVQQIDPIYALSTSSSFDALNSSRSSNIPQVGIQLAVKSASLESMQKEQVDHEEEKPRSPAVRELLRNSSRSVEPIRPTSSSINSNREPISPSRRNLYINVHTEEEHENEQVLPSEYGNGISSPLPTEPNTADSSVTSPGTTSSSANNGFAADEHAQASHGNATIASQHLPQQRYNQSTPPSNSIPNRISPNQLPPHTFHQHHVMPVQQPSPSQITHTVQKRQTLSISPINTTPPPHPTVLSNPVSHTPSAEYPEYGRYETSSADSDNDSQSITLSIQSSVFDASLAPSLQVTPSNPYFGGFFRGGSFNDGHYQHSPNMSRVASALISPPQSYYGNGNSWYVASSQSPQPPLPPQNISSNASVNSSASIEQAIQASLEEERIRREQELEYRRAVELALQQSLAETNNNNNNSKNGNNMTAGNSNAAAPAVMSPPTREHYDLIQHRMRLEQQRRIQLLQAMARQMDIDVNSASGNSAVESASEGGSSYNDNSGVSINSATIAVGDILQGEPSVYGNYSNYR